MPSRIRLSFGGPNSTPSFTIHTLDEDPSVSMPSRNWIASVASCSAAYCAASTLPSRDTDLISQYSQRLSSIVTQDTPAARTAGDGSTSGLVMMNTVGTTVAGKAWARLATPRVTCRYTIWSSSG